MQIDFDTMGPLCCSLPEAPPGPWTAQLTCKIFIVLLLWHHAIGMATGPTGHMPSWYWHGHRRIRVCGYGDCSIVIHCKCYNLHYGHTGDSLEETLLVLNLSSSSVLGGFFVGSGSIWGAASYLLHRFCSPVPSIA